MRIEEYEYGRIRIDGREERSDVILTDELHPDWWRDEGHALSMDDLKIVVEAGPDVLVVGTGTQGNMRPEPGLEQELAERGIEVEVHRSPRAVERYNELTELGERSVAAAFHLTC